MRTFVLFSVTSQQTLKTTKATHADVGLLNALVLLVDFEENLVGGDGEVALQAQAGAHEVGFRHQ